MVSFAQRILGNLQFLFIILYNIQCLNVIDDDPSRFFCFSLCSILKTIESELETNILINPSPAKLSLCFDKWDSFYHLAKHITTFESHWFYFFYYCLKIFTQNIMKKVNLLNGQNLIFLYLLYYLYNANSHILLENYIYIYVYIHRDMDMQVYIWKFHNETIML